VLLLIEKYKMKALLDVHTQRDSQNGLDNSGDTADYAYKGSFSTDGATIIEHWNMRGANWLGHYNLDTKEYDSLNTSNFLHSVRVVDNMLDRYASYPVVTGIEPVNEPWDHTPMPWLQEFYWRVYTLVQLKAPHWLTLLHDSFRLSGDVWGNFLTNCDNYAMDTHLYLAWSWANDAPYYAKAACGSGDHIKEIEALGIPVIVGEWSLATDNCAMWLNGFNDNVPSYPKVRSIVFGVVMLFVVVLCYSPLLLPFFFSRNRFAIASR
jgi:glucan 1,3-beta-glucosidase